MSDVSQIGASLSDLVAHVHALVTENEKKEFLKQRLLDISASAKSILIYAERIANTRESK